MSLLKSCAWLLLALVIQQTVVRVAGLGEARPDLVLIVLVAMTLRHGSVVGLYSGLFIGLIQDVYAIDALGANALAKTLLGYLLGWLDESRVKLQPITRILLLGTGFVFHEVIYFWAAGIGRSAYLGALWSVSFPSLVYTLLVASLLFAFQPQRANREGI